MNFAKILLLATVMTACFAWCKPERESMTAVQVLKRYVEVSTSMTDLEQRETLLAYTGGALRAALEGATDEEITQDFIARKFDLDSFAIVTRRDRTPREVEITFRISYYDRKDLAPEDEPPLVATTNTVTLFKENNMWSITDVIGHEDTEIHFGVTTDSHIRAKQN